MTQPIVYLIDDDENFLTSCSLIVRQDGKLPVCIDDYSTSLTQRFVPTNGCIVLDLPLPNSRGLDLFKALIKNSNALPIIITIDYADVALAVRCMELGAFTVIEKPVEKKAFLEKVNSAITRVNCDSEVITERFSAISRLNILSKRETQVAELLADGMKASHIAKQLAISPRTVESHRENLLRKLQLTSISQISGLFAVAKLGNSRV